MAALMSMQPSIPEDDDDDDDGNDSESFLLKSPYSSEDHLLGRDYTSPLQRSIFGEKQNAPSFWKRDEVVVNSNHVRYEEKGNRGGKPDSNTDTTKSLQGNQTTENQSTVSKLIDDKTKKESIKIPLIAIATPRPRNGYRCNTSWLNFSPQRCKSSDVLLPLDGKIDKIKRIRESTQKPRPQLPDEQESLQNERNEARTKQISTENNGNILKEKEESIYKSTVSNRQEEKKSIDATSEGRKLFSQQRDRKEHLNFKYDHGLYQRQISEWNKKQNNRNNTISIIRQQSLKNEKCTCNARMRRNENLYLVDASDLLFSSRQLANMERRKNFKSETWSEREGYQRRKVLGLEKDWDMKNRDLRNTRTPNIRRHYAMDYKGYPDKSKTHMKYPESLPNQLKNSKLKPKSFSLENKQRDQCFFIGLDQSCSYGNMYSNSYHGNVCKSKQDNNNNFSKWHYSNNSSSFTQRKKYKKAISKTTRSFYKLQYMLIGEKLLEARFPNNHEKTSSIKRVVTDFFGKVRSYYKIWKYTGYKMKMTNSFQVMKNIETSKSKLLHSFRECKSSDIPSGAAPSQQDGDYSNATNGGNHWWRTSRGNSENSKTNEEGRKSELGDASKKSNPNVSPVIKSVSDIHRSFDVDYRGRKKKVSNRPAYHRSISSEEDKNRGSFAPTIKYRDKKLSQRLSTDDLSSSSEDPADNLKGVLNARMSKSCDRKKTSPTNRKEGMLKSFGRDLSRSRKRYVKVKSDQSSSSHSSSSSRSGSRTRSGAKSAPRTKRKSVSKEDNPSDTNSKKGDSHDDKYDPSQFLERLDNVLSDLVENEKKKISAAGQLKIKETKHESFDELIAKKRPQRKAEKALVKKRAPSDTNEDINPSIQQLRATLRAVRVKKRSPNPVDLIDKHSERFTERLPHNPRILKSQHPSQLLTQRCYQPPKRKPAKPTTSQNEETVDYPSDFYSSDEAHEELQRVCTDDQLAVEKNPNNAKESDEKTDITTDEKDEIDTCYGSDQITSRDSASTSNKRMQELMTSSAQGDTGDSGEFSVDSAYTGSRGATPESILNPSVKALRSGGSLTTPPLPTTRFYSSFRRMPRKERLVELKRTILNDIRESKLYSDESINHLLAEYKRKCCDLSTKEVQEVILSIQEDLGVKPRPDYYVCHMLKVAEEIRQKKSKSQNSKGEKKPENPSACQSTKASTNSEDSSTIIDSEKSNKTYSNKEKPKELLIPEDNSIQRAFTLSNSPLGFKSSKELPTPNRDSNHRPKSTKHDAEDKAWAESIIGDVAPDLLVQAQEEADLQDDDSENEWSGYVDDICNQFDIKI